MAGLQEILVANEYDPVAPYLANRSAPLVLDIGANVGAFAAFAFGVCPSARVWSVEPSIDTYDLLHRNAQTNSAVDWSTLRAAVWTRDGQVAFRPGGQSTGRRIVSDDPGEDVPSITLARLIDRAAGSAGRIALAKFDIEGAEEAVLMHGSAFLHRIDALVVEVHAPDSREASVRQLLAQMFAAVDTVKGRASAKTVLIASRPPAA